MQLTMYVNRWVSEAQLFSVDMLDKTMFARSRMKARKEFSFFPPLISHVLWSACSWPHCVIIDALSHESHTAVTMVLLFPELGFQVKHVTSSSHSRRSQGTSSQSTEIITADKHRVESHLFTNRLISNLEQWWHGRWERGQLRSQLSPSSHEITDGMNALEGSSGKGLAVGACTGKCVLGKYVCKNVEKNLTAFSRASGQGKNGQR